MTFTQSTYSKRVADYKIISNKKEWKDGVYTFVFVSFSQCWWLYQPRKDRGMPRNAIHPAYNATVYTAVQSDRMHTIYLWVGCWLIAMATQSDRIWQLESRDLGHKGDICNQKKKEWHSCVHTGEFQICLTLYSVTLAEILFIRVHKLSQIISFLAVPKLIIRTMSQRRKLRV